MRRVGHYDEVKHDPVMVHIIETLKKTSIEDNKQDIEDLADEIEEADPDLMKKLSADSGGSKELKNLMAEEGSNITTNEEDEEVNAEWGVYFKYYTTKCAWIIFVMSFPFYVLYTYSGI